MSDILYNLIRRKDYVPDNPVCCKMSIVGHRGVVLHVY